MKRLSVVLCACLCVSPLYAGLTPVIYSFDCITYNSTASAFVGESQLTMELSATDDGVQFTFRNDGPNPAIIAQIYFYDGVLLDLSFIDDACDGVEMVTGANPGHLPGFVSPPGNPLVVYEAVGFDPRGGGVGNGVGRGQWVTIHWTLLEGHDLDSLVANIASGEVVVGVHVQGFDDGTSESFVTLVPEPATLLLGLGSLTLFLKRR